MELIASHNEHKDGPVDNPGRVPHLVLCGDVFEAAGLQSMLARSGFNVDIQIASSGGDFIDKLSGSEANCILVSGSLDRNQWLEAVKNARHTAPWIPCIALCSSKDRRDIIDAFRNGAADCADPSCPGDVAQALSKVLGKGTDVFDASPYDNVRAARNIDPHRRNERSNDGNGMLAGQRDMEKIVHESEARYRSLFDNMSSGVTVFTPVGDGGINFYVREINRAGERMYDVPPGSLFGMQFSEAFPGLHESGFTDIIQRVWMMGKPEMYPYIEYDQDSSLSRWIEYNLYRMPSGDIVAVYDDVSEQRKAQECLTRQQHELARVNDRLQFQMGKLEESERKYRTLAEHLPDIVQRFNGDGKHLYVSGNIFSLTGKPAGFYRDKTNAEAGFTEEEREIRERYLSEVFNTGEPAEFEASLKGIGGIKNVNIRMIPEFEAGGVVKSVVSITRDITEWNKAERYRAFAITILNLLNSDIAQKDVIGDILDQVTRFTGFDAVAIRLKEGDDFPFARVYGFSDGFISNESRLYRENGAGVPCQMCGNVLTGNTEPSLPFFTPGGSFWTGNSTGFPGCTAGDGPRLPEIGRCRGEGYESMALIPLRSYSDVVGMLLLCDSKRGMVDRTFIEFFEGIGASIGIALVRKASDEKIRSSLIEKEILLKEIHHRVKNNLQVISSLLYLQSEYVDDAKVRESLVISQNRIRTMALVHEKIYRSSNLSEVDLEDYVVTLVEELSNSFSAADRIDFTVDMHGLNLDIDSAIPCALIVNELVTNSIKHAFPQGRKGKIGVNFNVEEGRGYRLIVEDDGVGFKNQSDETGGDTLGIQLVDALVKQMGGTMNLDTGGGTRYTIIFNR